MANSLLTIDMITREALRLFINSNAFLKNVDRQYDDQFARTGAKIGDTLRIRLPNDYTVRTGKTASIQDTVEQNRSLTVSTQQGVDLSFSSAERALKLDDFSDRVLRPAMNNLAGAVALSLMGNAESVSNMIFKDNGSGGIATPDASTWLLAGAKLDNNSAPR
ncbi:UNVERIFIED_CONTAM: P22 phage major capsid protein family protein, partial [Pseudomonas aeruginosa]